MFLSIILAAFLTIYYSVHSSFDGLIPKSETLISFLAYALPISFFILFVALFGKYLERNRQAKIAAYELEKELKEAERNRFVANSIFNENMKIKPYNSHFFNMRFFPAKRELIEAPNLIERWLPHLKDVDLATVYSIDDHLFEIKDEGWKIGVCAKPDAIIQINHKYLVIEYKSYPEININQLELAQLQNVVSALVFSISKNIDLTNLVSVVRVNWGCYNFENLANTHKFLLYYTYLVGQNKQIFANYFSLKNNLISATHLSKIIYLGEANEQNNLLIEQSDRQLKGDIHHCKMASDKVITDKLFNN